MAGTLPAASDESAFGVSVSNLIEVTQTRSSYGQVMNKRAAAGDRSSDTNDRSEPCVHFCIGSCLHFSVCVCVSGATAPPVIRTLHARPCRLSLYSLSLSVRAGKEEGQVAVRVGVCCCACMLSQFGTVCSQIRRIACGASNV